MAPSSQKNTFADIPIPPSELGCQTLFLLILNLANQAVLNKSVKYLYLTAVRYLTGCQTLFLIKVSSQDVLNKCEVFISIRGRTSI